MHNMRTVSRKLHWIMRMRVDTEGSEYYYIRQGTLRICVDTSSSNNVMAYGYTYYFNLRLYIEYIFSKNTQL